MDNNQIEEKIEKEKNHEGGLFVDLEASPIVTEEIKPAQKKLALRKIWRPFAKLIKLPVKIFVSLKNKIKVFLGKIKRTFIKVAKRIFTKKILGFSAIILTLLLVIAWLVLWNFYNYPVHDKIIHFLKTRDFNTFVATCFGFVFVIIVGNIFFVWLSIKLKSAFAKTLFFLNLFSILAIIGILTATYVFEHPLLQSSFPEYDQNLQDYSKPLKVVFNVPVRESKLKESIVQDWEGTWEWEPYLGIPGFTRVGKFYPKVSALPEQRFVVYIAGINKISDKKEHEYGYVFKAPTLPKILSTYPAQDFNSFQRDENLTLYLDKNASQLVDWEFKLTPEVEFELELSQDKKVIINPKQNLKQGQTYTLDISYKSKIVNLETNETLHIENPVKIQTLKFSVAKEPLIESFEPSGTTVRPDSKIKIKFVEEMDMATFEGKFQITPEIQGASTWENSKTFIFTPNELLKKDTTYKVKILQGIRSAKGGVTEKDINYEFKTPGKVKVIAFEPGDGANYVNENTTIKISFDQEVDKQSVEQRLYISPYIPGKVSWEGNKLIYNLSSPMNYQTTYEIKIASGVKTVYGLDSDQDFVAHFTTRTNYVLFYIPIYYQPPGFACNIFTAKMILAWKGYYLDYTSIIAEIGYDPGNNGNWTGNPYAEYVGNADGSWGYGVYYPPIQNVLAARGIGSEPHVGWDIYSMARAVEQGHPVIIWRYNGVGGGQDISWVSDDGTYVNAFNGMHGSVITGFIGTTDNPSSFYINDPWLGQFWIDAGLLDYYWSFSGRMALVVY